MKARVVNRLTAARLRMELRRQNYCSWPWVKALVAPIAGDSTWQYLPHLYPPGGRETLMRKCPLCERMRPPNSSGGSICCNCEVERSEVKWYRRRNFRQAMPHLWWRRPLPNAVFMKGLIAAPIEQPCPWCLGNDHIRREKRGVRQCTRCGTHWDGRPRRRPTPTFSADTQSDDFTIHEENAFYVDEEDKGSDNAGGLTRISAEIAMNRMNPPKEAGRAPGSGIFPLLSESAGALEKEIAYFDAHGRPKPSTSPLPDAPRPIRR